MHHKVLPFNEEVYELEAETTGVFIGELCKGQITVNRHEIKKLLDPMYEEDLVGTAGKMVLELIGDPFPAMYKEKEELMNGK